MNGKGILSGEYEIEFDGEYLKGNNWNGKIYDFDGNIICELKGGKGLMKIYNRDDILICEAKYLNGELNGKIKEYDDEGKIRFEGELIDGKKMEK